MPGMAMVAVLQMGRLSASSLTISLVSSFTHRQGVGSIKRLDVRHLWLQELVEKQLVRVQKIPRLSNAADMMTHPPSAKELASFCPMVGLFPVEFAMQPLKHVVEALIPRGKGSPMSAKAMTQGLLLISALGSSKAAEVMQVVTAEPVVEYPFSAVPVPVDPNQILLIFSVEQISIAVTIFISMFWLIVFRVLRRKAPASNVPQLSHSAMLR